MHHFITGVAGFVGSHLADSLIDAGDRVSGVDDYSLGRAANLDYARRSPRFCFIERDIAAREDSIWSLRAACEWGGPPDIIWHLAANSDIAAGMANATVDFRKTLQTTFSIVEAAKVLGIRSIAFASTSAIYGLHDVPLTENTGPLLPISNYGATKLASEALLSAAAESFLDRIWIFRFPNVVGTRATHGAILDFVRRLEAGTSSLKVLGDGTQTKLYIHVAELIAAMRFITTHAVERRNVFNIGPDGPGTSVSFIAQHVIARVRPGASIAYTGGDRGWVGDVPRFRYSTERLERLGWRPTRSSDEAVRLGIEEMTKVSDRVIRNA